MLKTIILNNRLDFYGQYIKVAQENGYKVCSLKDFFYDRDSGAKHFILRHDIDKSSKPARKMFEKEMSLGVKSTYYFRHSTIDEELIKDMLANGFEVGLHYETISDWAVAHGITKKEDVDFSECAKILKNEIAQFKQKYNPNMVSIASHGAPVNSFLQCSNNVLVENTGGGIIILIFCLKLTTKIFMKIISTIILWMAMYAGTTVFLMTELLL